MGCDDRVRVGMRLTGRLLANFFAQRLDESLEYSWSIPSTMSLCTQ